MSRRLEMVHSDTCGPLRTTTMAGAKSFVLCTDDYSTMVWCFFMKSKMEKMEALEKFKARTERHASEKILLFRFDNGRAEYDKREF